jgi:hypothetical protein
MKVGLLHFDSIKTYGLLEQLIAQTVYTKCKKINTQQFGRAVIVYTVLHTFIQEVSASNVS